MPAHPHVHDLALLLLGGFDARWQDRTIVGITYNKMRALLAYLAVERGREHSREALAGLLWCDNNDLTIARGNLRRTLSDLRRVLEQPTGIALFSASKHTLSFAAGTYVDVLEFTAAVPSCIHEPAAGYCNRCIAQMERMAELYRGEFMAGFSLPDCPDFEDWLQLQRESLRRRALALLERLSNCHEQAGNYGRALPFALRYTELEPWDESGHRRAMRLYSLNGQASAALVQYAFCCRMLEQELGVLPNDETRGLAESIRKEGVLPELPGLAGEPPATSLQPLATERRQVSVLYCELALSEIEDPEEAMELLRAPQARCMEIIRRFSGHIVQAYGGGLLAYFGYPQAHEHATRHAVQAALAAARETARGIDIRASVHTGLIVAGREPFMPDTSGRTSLIAAQLRHGAASGEVVISRETRSIVDGYFDCVWLGAKALPGLPNSLEIFRVVKESGAHGRLEAAIRLTPLAGRKNEIRQLLKLWQKAVHGSRQVLLIRGEAGVGKSRLLLTLKQRLAGQPHVVRELRCFPEFSRSPYYPLIAMLEGIFGFECGDAPEAKSGKLDSYFEAHYPGLAHDAVSLLAPLFSVPPGDRCQALGLSPQKQKERTAAILLELLQTPAAQQPVLLIVEDLHWADPTTLELLSQFAGQAGRGAIFAAFTARPEFTPSWAEASNTTLELMPLADVEVEQMAASLNAELPGETLRRIVQRADGIPLFVEEMAKMAMPGKQAGIPATLRDLLAARMDQMGEAKYTAQLAATLGREFDLNVLRKVFPHDPAALVHGLSALQDAGLISNVNGTVCQFKHALLQEAAYQSQTRDARQSAHQRIAQVLQSDFPEIVANRAELLAQHLSAAGEMGQSIEYWLRAGQRAALNSANLEATGHFNSALQLSASLPESQERDQTEFRILVNFCPVLYAAKGYGSEEATQANTRLSVLGERMGDSPELFQAKWALVMNTIANTGSREVAGSAMRLLNMAHGDPLRKQAAHYAIADAAFWRGEFETTRLHAEHALALYRPQQHRMLLERFGEDLSVSCAAYLSWALYFLGFPDRAQQVSARMLKQARKLAHPHTLGLALCFASVLHRWLNKPAETLALSAETMAISRQHDFSVWLAAGEMAHGWALVMLGREEGVAELEASIAGMREAIGGISIVFLSALVEACVHLKRYDEALDLLVQAQADASNTGDGHYMAELHRIEGECQLALSPTNAELAESCFARALAASRMQHAKSLELRAALSMAGLWQQQGRRGDARRLLEEILNRFTEGFDTCDLRQAAKLRAIPD